MAGFSLDLSGVKQIKDAIDKIDEKATEGLKNELSASALTIEKTAKRMAPANFGKLRQSINHDISGELFKSVFSTVSYAPYVEFGTKSKPNLNIPQGFEQFAAQYKGKKASGQASMYDAIKLWVKRKGIDPKLTYVIFRKIMRYGIKAQPFMIPAYEQEKPRLIKRLKNLFK